MNKPLIDRLNIGNLTRLWKKMGAQVTAVQPSGSLNTSISWPYRVWLDGITEKNNALEIVNHFSDIPPHAIVPVWHATDDAIAGQRIFSEHGFELRLSQTAMFLDLKDYQPTTCPAIQIEQVQSPKETEVWTNIASEAFGYVIDVNVIRRIAGDPEIRLLLVYDNDEPAATALLFKTENILGVHLVGVPEKHRGKGLAYALMQRVIEHGYLWGARYITLQASSAGIGIYKKLGFKQQFFINSYQRIQNVEHIRRHQPFSQDDKVHQK